MVPREFLGMYFAANGFAIAILLLAFLRPEAARWTIAALLASRVPARRNLGAAGAWVFLFAIAPLGVGSGFPFSLTFSAAFYVALAPKQMAEWRATA